MDENNDKIISEAFESLPKKVQDIILDDKWRTIVKVETRKNDLSEDQWAIVENELFLVMIGVESATTYIENLVKNADIPEDMATDMALEFQNKILTNLKNVAIEEYGKKTTTDTHSDQNSLNRDDILNQIQDSETGEEDEEESLLSKSISENKLKEEEIKPEPLFPPTTFVPKPTTTPEPVITPPPVIKQREQEIPKNLPIGNFNEKGTFSPMDQKLKTGVTSKKEEVLISDKIGNIPTNKEYSIDPYREPVQ